MIDFKMEFFLQKQIHKETQKCTELILSWKDKKQLLAIAKQKMSSDAIIRYLKLVNVYLITDPILSLLFESVKQHPLLLECVYQKRYLTPDVISLPYYDQIKQKTHELGYTLGDFYHSHCTVFYMIGQMIGFYIHSPQPVYWFENSNTETFFLKQI